MKKIKAFIFDLDGTLVNSSSTIKAAYRYALAPWNVSITKDDIERIRSKSSTDLFDDWLPDTHDQQEAFSRLQYYAKQYISEIKLFPGVMQLLNKMRTLNYSMAIWTGRDTESAIRLIHHLGIGHFFSTVLGNTSVKNNKPSPEGLYKIATILEIGTSEFAVIGDHDHDIQGAMNADCFSIRANWRDTNPTHRQELKADIIFRNPDEMAHWLEQITFPAILQAEA